MAVDEAAARVGNDRPDSRYKWVALTNTTAGVLLATIDSSIMLIAMPDIFRGIHLDPLVPANSFCSGGQDVSRPSWRPRPARSGARAHGVLAEVVFSHGFDELRRRVVELDAGAQVRRMTYFSADPGQLSAGVDPPASGVGCAVELTELTMLGKSWWTLGFEANGPTGALQSLVESAAAQVFGQPIGKQQELSLDDCVSYSSWLRDRVHYR